MLARGYPTPLRYRHTGRSQLSSRKVLFGEKQLMKKMACTKPVWLRQKMVTEKLQFQGGHENQPCIFPVPYFETQPHFWGYFIVSTIEVSQSSCNEKFWPHKLGCFIPKMRKVFVLRNRSMNRGFTDFLVRASSFPALMFNGKKTHIKRKIENGKLSSLFFILYDSCTFCFIILIHE